MKKMSNYKLEKLWDELEDVLIDEEECLLSDWHIFKKGTHREEIWHWFDENHAKGVGWLMCEREVRFPRIYFDRSWNQSTIRNIVANNCYLQFGVHENLKALCIYPYALDEDPVSDYQELAFVVPQKWLEKKAHELFEVDELDHWLQNEYTTEESEIIFEKAIQERQVVMVDFS